MDVPHGRVPKPAYTAVQKGILRPSTDRSYLVINFGEIILRVVFEQNILEIKLETNFFFLASLRGKYSIFKRSFKV